MFCSFKSCTIILKFNHEPISILSRQVYTLNTLTYLSYSDIFTTALHIFIDNNHPCLSTFLFYYRSTKKLSKSGNQQFFRNTQFRLRFLLNLAASFIITSSQLRLIISREQLPPAFTTFYFLEIYNEDANKPLVVLVLIIPVMK